MAPNILRCACLRSPSIRFTATSKARLSGCRGHHAAHAARLELVSFDPDGRPLSLGANHAARGDELQGANAIQPRRPVHAQLHHAPNRQFVFGGEQNPAAADVQRGTAAHDPGSPGLNQAITYVLTNRKPVSTPTFRGPSDWST